jgi:apolipoprotein D and lipocalin family protein
MMLKRSALLAALPLALLSAPAQAAAPPQPTQKVELTKMTGRWYEVARLPNKIQRGCQDATSDWVRTGETFQVVQACRQNGAKKEWKAKARVSDTSTNAKFKMSFFGGMVNQEYWVLDRAADHSWVILGTPGGNYVWLMSRGPDLAANIKSQALARMRQLGYDTGRLEFDAK